MSHADTTPSVERVASGILGLDTILRGGFRRGGLYVITGHPGTGKTTLGNQLCFNHVAAGGRAAYVTLFTETHGHLFDHLRSLRFFSMDVVGDALYYVSGASALEEQGYQGLLDLLRAHIRQQRATVLVLDGIPTEAETAASTLTFRRFLQLLQVTMDSSEYTSI